VMQKQMISAIAAVLCSASLAWASSAPSDSANYPSIPTKAAKIVFVRSAIQVGEGRIFLEVVNAARPDIIGVDSPGGRIDEALRIAREFRAAASTRSSTATATAPQPARCCS
jgi:hypothetical protein